ncbi:glutamine-hydrolyzing carbamoyl-phosphate synthase small subunit [Methanococcus voltae]|uniref:Carbamoyl phosphate synthase small chain n=1 Tax=Methanococcus voltae (strain ATCC BAA-1334 / A3) TaxID=456320 RepID=D7DUM0_METV3|nr:glutamine-hydrolyzing carbamoyl-phosphate synthase small subunit [Methanococcus voltae]MCS3900631.1 carbamoyl-phosphate synthase small subunit [Methanococcus voltae]
MYAVLILEDGTVIQGKGFGAESEVLGELVFNTSMTGYVEVLTDPSYKGQIITMTYPLEGNYGVKKEWYESEGIHSEGFVIKDLTSNELDNFLKENSIPGIYGVDTRYITKKIRSKGVLKALLKSSKTEIKEDEISNLIQKVNDYQDISEIEMVSKVSTTKKIVHQPTSKTVVKCVLIDCGVKSSIIDCLVERNCEVIQVPYNTTAKEILDEKPDFVLISNGPGDPELVKDTIETIKQLIGKLPITGICMGNQLLTLALGGKTYKLKFGHRGGNQPVKDLETGKVYMTSQNHGFATDYENIPEGYEVANINLNDNTVEGIHKLVVESENNVKMPVWSVQYHPEAGPGPHDARFLFDRMIEMALKYKN